MILIIDDEPQVRAMIGRALTELGYPVREAASGPEGLAAIADERPALVILDYVMPDMDGAETAREIAAIDEAIPVVFSTGHGALRALRDAAGDEASILHKPFTLAELDALISRAMGTAPRLQSA
jgi:CheY-like chemotaxis protein